MSGTRGEVWRWLGVSVRGPVHAREGRPNQDAWLGRAFRNGATISVCDGLGSRRDSDFGARKGCLAAAEAARIWGRAAGAPVELLLRLVHDLWAVHVHPFDKGDCATTCLLAAVCDDRLIIAQLGDGLAMIAMPAGEPVVVKDSRNGDFGNQTTGLGITNSLRDWRWHDTSVEPGTLVLLATDGVADDVRSERRAEFAKYLRTECQCLPPAARWRKLAGHLRNWPVPKHGDDKTIGLLWREACLK